MVTVLCDTIFFENWIIRTVPLVQSHRYHKRLIERGKHPLLVHNNIKNKMLHILVAMVRDRVKYNPDNVYRTSNEVSLAPQVLNI